MLFKPNTWRRLLAALTAEARLPEIWAGLALALGVLVAGPAHELVHLGQHGNHGCATEVCGAVDDAERDLVDAADDHGTPVPEAESDCVLCGQSVGKSVAGPAATRNGLEAVGLARSSGSEPSESWWDPSRPTRGPPRRA